jgi:hypothetical protein
MGINMITLEEKAIILSRMIAGVDLVISTIDLSWTETVDGKMSNQQVYDNLISEKNTYSQLLAELQ